WSLYAGAGPQAEDPALDADGEEEARRGVPLVSAHAAPRGRAPRRLHGAPAARVVSYAGVLQARVEPVPSADARGQGESDDADDGRVREATGRGAAAPALPSRRRPHGRDP